MLEDSFDKLIDYIDEHFAREEVFMKKIGYPNIVEHHGKHAEMEDKMRALFTRYSEGDPTVSEALGNFVEDWWYSHILKEDMKYREFAEG
jgi:hemerythrin